jgi:hypothetical protein
MEQESVEQVDQSTTTLMETPAEVAQGGSGNDFLNMIPEDLRNHPSLSPIKDVSNLAQSYVNAQRLIGAEKVPLPANPTDEDLDRIADRLGRPKTADDYNISVDGNVITEDVANSYKDIAHQLRLTPDQANGVLEYYKSVVQNSTELATSEIEAQRTEIEGQLKKEWGQAYDQKIKDAGSVVSQFASPEILEMRLEDGTMIGNHPEFIKAFANIADFRRTVTSEDTISEGTSSYAMTPDEAKAEADAIMRSPEYTDKKNYVARQRAVSRVAELMDMIHG